MGKPTSRAWTRSGYIQTLPQASDKTAWKCHTVAERQVSDADREAWYALKPGCRAQYKATEGMAHSASLGGFIGAGVAKPGDAAVLKYTPPAIPIPASPAPANIAPVRSSAGAFAPQLSGGDPVRRTAQIGTLVGTTVGGPLGGLIGGGLGGLIGGRSKCPGPYNYNPATGGCDPKPGTFAGPETGHTSGNCPAGSHWDGRGCKKDGATGVIQDWLPGGQTGYVEAGGGFYQTPYGFAKDPDVVTIQRRTCPRGMILGSDGKCYHKGNPKKGTGITNSMRQHPKPPAPVLSSQDAKTLRKVESIRKRVKRAAQNAGYKGMKL